MYTKHRNLKMHIFSERGYMFQNNRRSVKTYPTIPWPQLSHSELGQLILLSRLMDDGNKIPLTTAKISEVLAQSVNRTYVFIRTMIKVGVMKRLGRELYINPLYLFAGKHMSHSLFLLFEDSLGEYLPNWVQKEWSDWT